MAETSIWKRIAVRAAEGSASTFTVAGLIVAGFWYFAPSVATYVSGLVTKDIEARAIDYVRARLEFYTSTDTVWRDQDSWADCDNADAGLSGKLVAGACEGWSGTPQTSVGPVYEETAQGKPRIHCMRFSTYQTKATAFCFRIKS
jgi:hypothetical protein